MQVKLHNVKKDQLAKMDYSPLSAGQWPKASK
jgi:hypothetical protein